MDINIAIEKLEVLANGIDPETGEQFSDNSPYNNPQVIRALFTVISAFKLPKGKKSPEQKQEENRLKGLPQNAGLPWTDNGRNELAKCFNEGAPPPQLAQIHQRTSGAIIAELKKQGLIEDD